MAMLDLVHIVLGQQWLSGAFLSVVGGFVACVGLTVQKSAQYKLLKSKMHTIDGHIAIVKQPSWCTLFRSIEWWAGVLIFVAHSPINLYALTYAPETTFTLLSASVVLFNFVFAYGFLNERFTRRDLLATFVCIAASFTMDYATPPGRSAHMDDFPIEEILEFYNDLSTNVGFAAYLLVWFALALTCLYVLFNVSMHNVAKPMVYPVLVGLFQSQFHFVSKISHSLVMRAGSHPELWKDSRFYICLCLTAFFYSASVVFTIQGCRNLAMRFFVPAMYVSVTCCVVVESLLFFRYWHAMTTEDIWLYFLAGLICMLGVFAIRPVFRVISSPDLYSPLQQAVDLRLPLLGKPSNVIDHHEAVLSIMAEYKLMQAEAKAPGVLDAYPMEDYRGTWRWVPLAVCVLLVGLPLACFFAGYVFLSFTFLTFFQIYTGWKMSMHIALFSYVGIKKVAHYHGADFKALHEAEESERMNLKGRDDLSKRPPFAWHEVFHFVLLPNYKEDLEVLRLAIDSVAQSAIAKTNIIMVLAMEEREQGSVDKARALTSEFSGKFLHVQSTFHPPNLEGETAGKSSNTRWAANRVFDEVMPAQGIDISRAVFTVADADSEFHSKYFAALTYHFLHAGGVEGEPAQRYMTIWQPPILHYKNFITQPAIVRLCSLVTSQHELANLADPNATRIPYSTYSISAQLAQQVNGWDPDWISEDWHMCLKCFLATRGKLKVFPIFYPVCNYAPEGESTYKTIQARWVQAKRHALGFSELVYFHDYFPRVARSIRTSWDRAVFAWRSFFMWVKMVTIHCVMAGLVILNPLNGFMIAYLVHDGVTEALNLNSWTFLTNCVFQLMGVVSITIAYGVSALLYESQKHRIDGSSHPQLSVWWTNPFLHTIGIITQSLLVMPMFFFFAGLAEWIAAVKTARTHKFKYDVALKPVLNKENGQGQP